MIFAYVAIGAGAEAESALRFANSAGSCCGGNNVLAYASILCVGSCPTVGIASRSMVPLVVGGFTGLAVRVCGPSAVGAVRVANLADDSLVVITMDEVAWLATCIAAPCVTVIVIITGGSIAPAMMISHVVATCRFTDRYRAYDYE
jgi:hypothetical protein